MTFTKFMDLLQTKYPKAQATMHGKFGGTDKNKKVEIHFTPNSKCYFYYGSYQDVLKKVGVNVAYASDIKIAEEKLAEYKEKHGKEYCDFGFPIKYDYTVEIEQLENLLNELRNCIVI